MKFCTLVVPLLLAGCVSAGTPAEREGAARKSALPDSGPGAALIGSGPVVVAPDVVDGWRFMYRFITEVEFVLCLEGRRSGDKVYIDSFRLARMEAANSSSVRYQPCSGENYIGTAHNHPPMPTTKSLCYQSLPDRRSFDADTRAVLDIVLCGDDRFLWVVRRNRSGTQEQGEAVIATPPSF